jgi:NO-binding membrane sensor protein with MHYT domain
MLRVVGSIVHDHDPGLIALGLLVCVLATTVAAHLVSPHRTGEQTAIRTGAAIVGFSTGVWTAHFISILAIRTDVRSVSICRSARWP